MAGPTAAALPADGAVRIVTEQVCQAYESVVTSGYADLLKHDHDSVVDRRVPPVTLGAPPFERVFEESACHGRGAARTAHHRTGSAAVASRAARVATPSYEPVYEWINGMGVVLYEAADSRS